MASELCDKLTQIINNADTSIDALTLSIADKEAVMRKANDNLFEIEKEEKQLEHQEGRINEELEDSLIKSTNTESVIQQYLVLNEKDLIYKIREYSKLKEFR